MKFTNGTQDDLRFSSSLPKGVQEWTLGVLTGWLRYTTAGGGGEVFDGSLNPYHPLSIFLSSVLTLLR